MGTLAGTISGALPIHNAPHVAVPRFPRPAPWITDTACFVTRSSRELYDLLRRKHGAFDRDIYCDMIVAEILRQFSFVAQGNERARPQG